jgi:ribosomal protein S18 acetylase RimI-like enzyme
MPAAIHVRDASDDDRDTLFRFHKELYEAHRDQVVAQEDLPLIAYHDYERILADDLGALMRDPNASVLLAESGGRAIGYITGRVTTESRRILPRRGVVEDWYVEESSRGSGVGKQLLAELERRFAAAGCQVIESATWSANTDARNAHEALGFREIRVIYRKLV